MNMWVAQVDQVNALDGVVVRVEGGEVRLYTPRLSFKDMAIGLLQSLLIKACEGMYCGVIVKVECMCNSPCCNAFIGKALCRSLYTGSS
jgi:hypothetical protein